MNKYTIHILTFMFLWCCGAGASATELYFVHSDHLNTPQVITDFNQQVVWEGKRLPFGETDVTSTQIEFNLRFPGQYYDLETGLHYNYFRDYDPGLGRYVQSDPIGLGGGLNTYGYANQNPLYWIDPFGLRYNAWNAFQQANAGRGWTPGQMSQTYRDQQNQQLGGPRYPELHEGIGNLNDPATGACGLWFNCPPPPLPQPEPVCNLVCDEQPQQCMFDESQSGTLSITLPDGCRLICESGPQAKP